MPIKVVSPIDHKLIKEIPLHTNKDVIKIVENARKAFNDWSSLKYKDRARCFQKLRDQFLKHKDEMVEKIHRETGKAKMDALIEVLGSLDIMKFYEKNAKKYLAEKKTGGHGIMRHYASYYRYFPHGIVGVIAPWNYPLLLVMSDSIPALMAGNCVTLKPSSSTPLTALLVDKLYKEAGFPEGVYQTVVCLGSDKASDTFIREVDMIAFTGSTKTGLDIASKCVEQLKPISLELGGKDPMIVLEDANLERAANAAVFGSLFNSGQTCISVERIYVVEKIYEKFVSKVHNKIKDIRVGEDSDFDIDMGAVTTSSQYKMILKQIDDAVDKGAALLYGGKKMNMGYFIEPTLLVDLNEEMDIMKEETFGPVIAIRKVKDEEEAIRLANHSIYGLSSSIFTKNKKRGRDIAKKIETGSACINDCMANFMITEVPFAGVKMSGFGMGRNSACGIQRFCRVQSVVANRLPFKREIVWYPHSRKTAGLIKKTMSILYGRYPYDY